MFVFNSTRYNVHFLYLIARGTIRLFRNGFTLSSYTSGIVQIAYGSSSFSNSWGNICDDTSFGRTEANVICNQLGYNGVSTYGRAGDIR